MNRTPARDTHPAQPFGYVAKNVSERRSQEIVIALVGPIGSGVSTAAKYIHNFLKEEFNYQVCPIIKLSEIIENEAYRVDKNTSEVVNTINYYDKIDLMQDIGNSLRRKFHESYLAEKAIERIYGFRKNSGGFNETGLAIPGRRAYIIDSLKNPEELNILRQTYGDVLCLFGIFAPDEMRKRRLVNKGISEESAKKIMDRDRSELATFGQKTRKVFVQSDFFLCNDKKEESLRDDIHRFLNMIFNTAIHTPNKAESAMYEASSAAAKSACMSRQVGAAIISEDGELIAVGWNDVPRFGGGLYIEDNRNLWDSTKNGFINADHRCFNWDSFLCHNEKKRKKIIDDIVGRIFDAKVLKKNISRNDIFIILSKTPVNSLIEFSRSIHAEMECILSVAREGRHSLKNSVLYTTTYPCHNCARHIVASGIAEVVYIEPYEKSLAIELHSDSVTEDPNDKSRVVFRQYSGVAPRNYLRLFISSLERKYQGSLNNISARTAVPVFQRFLDASAEYERKIISDLFSKEAKPDITLDGEYVRKDDMCNSIETTDALLPLDLPITDKPEKVDLPGSYQTKVVEFVNPETMALRREVVNQVRASGIFPPPMEAGTKS